MLSTVAWCPLLVDDEDTVPTTAGLQGDWRRLELVAWADFGLPEGQLKLRQGYAASGRTFCISSGPCDDRPNSNGKHNMTKEIQGLTRNKKAKVKPSEIVTRPDDFQYRENEVENHHVEDLANLIRQGRPVDPLDVWKDDETGELVVIDGHHRHAAFKRTTTAKKVPIVIWQGSIEDARLHALQENAKARLPMTATEKSNAAWKLVCFKTDDAQPKPLYSKARVVKTTGVSEGTVASMRRKLRQLESSDDPEVPETWQGALALLKGRQREELDEDEREALIQERTARLDEKVGKEIATMADIQFDAVARMLEKRLGSKVRNLADWWRDVDAVGDECEEDDEELPF